MKRAHTTVDELAPLRGLRVGKSPLPLRPLRILVAAAAAAPRADVPKRNFPERSTPTEGWVTIERHISLHALSNSGSQSEIHE